MGKAYRSAMASRGKKVKLPLDTSKDQRIPANSEKCCASALVN